MQCFKRPQPKTKPENVPKIILEAIQYLEEPQGSSPTAIKKYIVNTYGKHKFEHRIIDQILINGVECGIIRKNGCYFKLNNGYETKRMRMWLQYAERQLLIYKTPKSILSPPPCRKRQVQKYKVKKSVLSFQSNRTDGKMLVAENKSLPNRTGWNIMKIAEPGGNPETVTGFVMKALETLQQKSPGSVMKARVFRPKNKNVPGEKMVQQKPRTEKVAKLIVEALHDLRESEGSTLKTIKKYITIRYGNRKLRDNMIPEALENGVKCGLITKTGNRYKLDTYLLFLAKKRFQFMKKKKKPSQNYTSKRKNFKTKRTTEYMARRKEEIFQRPGTSPEEAYKSKIKSLSGSTIAGLNKPTSKSKTLVSNRTREEKRKKPLLRNPSTPKTRKRLHKKRSLSFSNNSTIKIKRQKHTSKVDKTKTQFSNEKTATTYYFTRSYEKRRSGSNSSQFLSSNEEMSAPVSSKRKVRAITDDKKKIQKINKLPAKIEKRREKSKSKNSFDLQKSLTQQPVINSNKMALSAYKGKNKGPTFFSNTSYENSKNKKSFSLPSSRNKELKTNSYPINSNSDEETDSVRTISTNIKSKTNFIPNGKTNTTLLPVSSRNKNEEKTNNTSNKWNPFLLSPVKKDKSPEKLKKRLENQNNFIQSSQSTIDIPVRHAILTEKSKKIRAYNKSKPLPLKVRIPSPSIESSAQNTPEENESRNNSNSENKDSNEKSEENLG